MLLRNITRCLGSLLSLLLASLVARPSNNRFACCFATLLAALAASLLRIVAILAAPLKNTKLFASKLDNSESESVYFAKYEDGEINIFSQDDVPQWFYSYVIEKLS